MRQVFRHNAASVSEECTIDNELECGLGTMVHHHVSVWLLGICCQQHYAITGLVQVGHTHGLIESRLKLIGIPEVSDAR